GARLFTNKPDDFLIINVQKEDRAADFVFLVNPADVAEGNPKDKVQKIKDGVFIEVKRLARVDLSGREITMGVTPAPDVKVEHKPGVSKSKKAAGGAESSAGGEGAPPAG